MQLKPIQQKIYNSAYSCLQNAAHGKTKTAVENFQTVHKLGKENPAMTKLICRKAENDWRYQEIAKEGLTPGYYPIHRIFNNLKFEFNKQYQNMSKDINDVYKNLYPKTHKMRDKLINNDCVTLD